MPNYYNEHCKNAAAWLRELIAQKLIPAGEVDERSIVDVHPNDLRGFTQCHWFAGVGGWSQALFLAGWPSDRPVWTGSCPCQPFSTAGKGAGTADERHLWPAFKWLIDQCQPPVVFGEQVASAAGREWLAGVRSDLEGLAYEVGAADLCAAGIGAPHIRQRLFWVAYGQGQGRERVEPQCTTGKLIRPWSGSSGTDGGVGDTRSAGTRWNPRAASGEESSLCGTGNTDGLHSDYVAEPSSFDDDAFWGDGLAHHQGSQGHGRPVAVDDAQRWEGQERRGAAGGFWRDYTLVPCRDGKARRIESGSQPLVDGLPRGVVRVGAPDVQEAQATGESRVARLKGYGNAIVPPLAAEFILAAEEAR